MRRKTAQREEKGLLGAVWGPLSGLCLPLPEHTCPSHTGCLPFSEPLLGPGPFLVFSLNSHPPEEVYTLLWQLSIPRFSGEAPSELRSVCFLTLRLPPSGDQALPPPPWRPHTWLTVLHGPGHTQQVSGCDLPSLFLQGPNSHTLPVPSKGLRMALRMMAPVCQSVR